MKNLIILLIATLGSCSSKPAPQTHTVEIKQMAFVPAEMKIRKGDKVRFINYDIVAHNITEEPSKAWSSSPLQTEQSWTVEPEVSANYYCSLHPVMKGRIVVE